MTAQEIMEIIKANEEKYEFFGLRTDDAEYEIGEICKNSHEWYQDDPNGELEKDDAWYTPYNEEMKMWDGGELDGTSSVAVTAETVEDALKTFEAYKTIGTNYYILAGDYAQGGNDIGESIIRDAVVLARI